MHVVWQRLRSWGAALFVTGIAISSVDAGSSNSLMDISTDGRLLACSNRDSGTVTIVDLSSLSVTREVAVGDKPEGVTFVGDSHRLAVAIYAEDRVVTFDADTGKILGAVEVFDEPYGIVSSPAGDRLYVTLDFPGECLEIETSGYTVVRRFPVGRFVRGIALDAAAQQLYFTEYYTAHVLVWDLQEAKELHRWPAASTDNLLRQIALHPHRPKAYLPHIRSRVTAVHGEGSIFPYVSVLDTNYADGDRRHRIPMDAFLGNLVTANPWEVAISPDGRQAFAVFAGTNDMFVCDVLDDNYRELGYRKYMQLGTNPRAVRVSPDNRTVFVYQALDFNVVAYDTETLSKKAEVQVTSNPLGDEVLAGKKLFYSALQPMVSRRWISCSSCHPDGDPDGRTWHNPEGLRNTQALAGMAWTHPIHWSADRDEVQDFEHTIRGPLMQGKGLIQGELHGPLATPNGGLSAELDALAAYSNSHKFPLSPFAKKGLSDRARRGRELFLSAELKCVECHSGPLYCDSLPRAAAEIVRHDVGTGNADSSEKMGPAYDTPTLLGIYRTAPYLHHGQAETLTDVLTRCNTDDRHGKTSQLTSEQIQDLVEFLQSLPFEDPVPAAERAGLKTVHP